MHLGDLSGPIELPLPAFLIEHDRGLVLLDTGLKPEAHDTSFAEVYGEAFAAAWPTRCPPENRLDRQIEAAGFSPEDVTHVLVSHAHADHVGGLYLFPNAEFFISTEEARYAYWPMPFWEAGLARDDIDRARQNGSKWNLLAGDHDLFGDGSLQLLSTPGHTPGHMSLLVKLGSRNFLMAVDVGHTAKNLDGVPCPADLNGIQAYESVERVKQVAAANQADIWLMHDPGHWETFGQITGGHS
jgi:glyoxylase-like metal-dependent hydrolase (beta-lactamase superfamily II)